MKKVLVLAMVAVMSLSMAGCGKAKEAPAEAAATEEVATEETSSDNAAMAAYIELSQSTFDAMAESLKGMMEFNVSSEGNTLKYEMKVLVDMGDTEAMKTQFDAQMEAQKAQMEAVVDGLKAAGVEDPKFVVEYKDKDDNVIATYNF